MNIDAILPAGGRISGDFAREAGTEIKALIDFGGRTAIERTLQCLRATCRISRIVVVGPEELVSHQAARSADAVIPSDRSNSGPTNIMRGLEWIRRARAANRHERVLVVTTDLPFLTAQAINEFVDACPADADICVPIVSREEFEQAYPGSTNFYVRLRDGEWTIGCAFLVNPEAVEQNQAVIERVFRARKSQLGMARLLGIGLIARFLVGRLTVPVIEDRCRQILGCSVCSIRGCSPELAFDIDKPDEYRYAVAKLG